jgi:aspartate carbamoyltransferase catalytic subunit
VILPQVTYGIAVRMAIMALIMGGAPQTENAPAGGRRA